jgi:hypothetical protein
MNSSEAKVSSEPWFWDWLKRAWPWTYNVLESFRLRVVVEWASVAASAVAAVGLSLSLHKPTEYKQILYISNDLGHVLLVTLALLFFIPRLEAKKHRPDAIDDDIRRRLRHFKLAFASQLLFWLALYGIKTIKDLPAMVAGVSEWTAPQQHTFDHVLFGLNLVSAFSLMVMYRSLGRAAGSTFLRGFTAYVLVAIACLTSALFRIFDLGDALTDSGVQMTPGLLNGIISGTALSLLIGRLDSRYIGLSNATIVLLYIYALIQPLYPIVFPDSAGTPSDGALRIEQFFVLIALFMKGVFILQLGKLVDTGRLEFYLTSMSWLETHIEQLRAHHAIARENENEPSGGPPLYAFSYPERDRAALFLSRREVRVDLSLMNAWVGVAWDVRRFSIGEVKIDQVAFRVSQVRIEESLRIGKDDRVTRVRVFIDLGLTKQEFVERLSTGPSWSRLSANREKKVPLDVAVASIRAEMKVVDDRQGTYIWCPVESVLSRDGLSYQALVSASEVTKAATEVDEDEETDPIVVVPTRIPEADPA